MRWCWKSFGTYCAHADARQRAAASGATAAGCPPKVPQPLCQAPNPTCRKTPADGPARTPLPQTHHAWPRWHGGSQPHTSCQTGRPSAAQNRGPTGHCHPPAVPPRWKRAAKKTGGDPRGGDSVSSPGRPKGRNACFLSEVQAAGRPLVARRGEMPDLPSVFEPPARPSASQPPAGPGSPKEGAKLC